MNETEKHCDTCKYSYLEIENGHKMQHCSSSDYNGSDYTHAMRMEDWDKGPYCRFWAQKERRST